MKDLLTISNLSISFGSNTVVDGVSLSLNKGETLGIVGESGSGKSLTAFSVIGLQPGAAKVSGSIEFDGQELVGASSAIFQTIRGKRIAMIFQEPQSALNPLHRVGKQIKEVLHHCEGAKRPWQPEQSVDRRSQSPSEPVDGDYHVGANASPRNDVVSLLEKVGLDPTITRRYPHELSGGQRQRVMIAMAIANQPDLLIADEPTTALDVTLQEQILELLKQLQQETGMAMLFISHDLGVVKRVASHVVVMQCGKIVEHGAGSDVFSNPKDEYTKTLFDAAPKQKPVPLKNSEFGVQSLEETSRKAESRKQKEIQSNMGQKRGQQAEPLGVNVSERVEAKPDGEAETKQKPILQTKGLKVHFPIKKGVLRKTVGHVKAVDGISLSIQKGETLGIVGESGSGKSTLGFALLRLLQSDGPIMYLGRDISGFSHSKMRLLRADLQLVFQDPYASLNPRLTVGEIIAEGLRVHGSRHCERAKRTRQSPSAHTVGDYDVEANASPRNDEVTSILEKVGLDPSFINRFPHEFSGGQRQRIAIARAMILQPKLVVLDEPTSALDLTLQSQIIDLLQGFQREQGISYIFISHDLRVIRAMSHRILVMKEGKVVEEGTGKQILTHPQEKYTKALVDAAML